MMRVKVTKMGGAAGPGRLLEKLSREFPP